MTVPDHTAGLGSAQASLQVYIANRPPLAEYETLDRLRPMSAGEIGHIASATGNHWRKVFNVYAKLVAELSPQRLQQDGIRRWQDLRDRQLLQAGGQEALIFTPPDSTQRAEAVRLLLGKGYAQALGLTQQLHWLDTDFARHRPSGILLCPYFDYRQLSDVKIQRLVGYIRG